MNCNQLCLNPPQPNAANPLSFKAMTTEEAKVILSAYRPGKDDPEEAPLKAALELAASDPELSEWMALQARNDEAIRQVIGESTPAADLEARLLELAPEAPRRLARFPSIPAWGYAVAACFVIAVTALSFRSTIIENQLLGYFPQLSAVEKEATFRDAMALYVSSSIIQLDFTATNLDAITDWLTEQPTPSYNEIPNLLAARETIGCKSFLWRGQEVSLICFESPEGGIVHLFLMEKEGTEAATWDSIASHLTSHERKTVGWEDDELVYLLVGSDPDVAVAPYVGLS
jgi:hypothetical protein